MLFRGLAQKIGDIAQEFKAVAVEYGFPQRLKNDRLIAAVRRNDLKATNLYLQAGADPTANDFEALRHAAFTPNNQTFFPLGAAANSQFTGDGQRKGDRFQTYQELAVVGCVSRGEDAETRQLLKEGASASVAMNSAIDARQTNILDMLLARRGPVALSQNQINQGYALALMGGNEGALNRIRPHIKDFALSADQVYMLVRDGRALALETAVKDGVSVRKLAQLPSEWRTGRGAYSQERDGDARRRQVAAILEGAGLDMKTLHAANHTNAIRATGGRWGVSTNLPGYKPA